MNISIPKYPTRRKRLFWQFQFIFWFAHILFWIWIDPANLSNLTVFTVNTIQYIAPISLTILFRYFLKKYHIYNLSFISISIIVLVLSLFGGVVWLIEQKILVYLFYGKIIFSEISYSLFQSIWHQSYPFVAWNMIYLGFKFYEESIIQKENKEKALLLAKSSQLEMLKYQLNPHFLFNTLSSLRGLIVSEPLKAKVMVTNISEMLRYSLLEGKDNDVALSREIEIIRLYLDIEKIRFNDNLQVEFDIAPDSEDLIIPIFLIHPLIENAIKHGMQTSTMPLLVSVTTSFHEQVLSIEVKNSGNWIVKGMKSSTENGGIGLQNIQKRLEYTFPGRHSFEVKNENHFVKTIITIDFGK